MIAIVFDTETTGLLKPKTAPLEQQPKIIELAFIMVDNSGAILSEHEWLIHPGEEVTAEITKITGIKNEDLEGKPRFAEVVSEIAEAFKGADVLIAHNAPFDVGMLTNDLARLPEPFEFPWPKQTVCSVQEFYHELGRRMKLTELYKRKTGKDLAQTHRALDDVKALHEALVAAQFYSTLESVDDPTTNQD